MKNVLSVISELNFGGGENRLLNLARAIDRSRYRHSVALLYSRSAHQSCGSMRQDFVDAGIELHELNLPNPKDVRAPLRPLKLAATASTLGAAVARLRRLIVKERIDLVDAHLETGLYTAVPAAASAGVPAAVTLYSELDLWKIFDGQSMRRTLFPPLRRLGLQQCSAIFTDSEARARDLREFVGPRSRVHVVPNGVRLRPPAKSREEVLRFFGIPERKSAVVVGQVAGLVPYKGQAHLVRAVARAVAAGHDAIALCVGDERLGAQFPAELRALARSLGVEERLFMKGYPGDIADAWSIIDVHVHASSIDSLPNAVLEGMSCGKPAIVSAVGALPEHVDDGETGLVVPPGDAGAVSRALLRLLGDAALRHKLAEGARRRYQERFTPEISARQLERCFDEVLLRKRAA